MANTSQVERRFSTWSEAKLERADGSDAAHFRGHAAVFDTRTLIGSKRFGFYETIERGAFAGVLKDDVRFLDNHQPDRLLARTANGTLLLAEDQVGLAAEADLARTSVGRDVELLLERGDLDQMSFAFTVRKDSWEELSGDDDGMELRTIMEIGELYDVSTVTYGAYPTTDAGLRNASEAEVRGIMEEARRGPFAPDKDATAKAALERAGFKMKLLRSRD